MSAIVKSKSPNIPAMPELRPRSDPWEGILSSVEAEEDEKYICADGDRLFWGNNDHATMISMALSPAGPGFVSLAVSKEDSICESGDVMVVGRAQSTPLLVDQQTNEGFFLRTREGKYLAASRADSSVRLTTLRDEAAYLQFQHRDRMIKPLWAADEGDPIDETHSTHLWVFNQARDLIFSNSSLGSGHNVQSTYNEEHRIALKWCLSDYWNFRRAIQQGIYDADNKGKLDKDTSGFLFSAHFWNPKTGTGGTWDPNPQVNAFNYGMRYFSASLGTLDPATSGYNLGLAIHYLEDVTQPMHCGIFPNVPPLDYRHENYEQWALKKQAGWAITAAELNTMDIGISVDNPGAYWWQAAQRALEAYNNWYLDPKSPINVSLPNLEGASPPDYADDSWTPTASMMIILAQRLVTNLLMTWSAMSAAAAAKRGLAHATDTVLTLASKNLKIIGCQRYPNERADQAQIHYPTAIGADEAWILEPVIVDGKPFSDGSSKVYRIRSRRTGKCLVAGDVFDGNVYIQDPGDRLNGQWVFEELAGSEPVVGGQSRTRFKIRDRKHGKFLFADTFPSAFGPLQHSDQAGLWVQRDVASFS